ncbi:Periodic tryptophan protein 1 [Intoshia linei]|uniref:Periodic tryptophan protein 1 n=1 Tax=Intoshia linei TaxID=1819745 RepID=A0A177BB24_9BILA|nr:Periodic tryptophan protein 1 [Intoshia linei]
MKVIPDICWIKQGIPEEHPTKISIDKQYSSDCSEEENSICDSDNSSNSSDEDLQVLETDNLLVFPVVEDSYLFNLQVDVYTGDDIDDFYCHHDHMLDFHPLCIDNLHSDNGNFVVVGGKDGFLRLWDINIINSAEPQLYLGKSEENDDYSPTNENATLCVSAHKSDENVVCSGHLDNKLCVWDLNDSEKPKLSVTTKDSVTCIAWMNKSTILFGCDNSTIALRDIREKKSKSKTNSQFYNLDGAVESLFCCFHNTNSIFVCTNKNTMYEMDTRNFNKPTEKLELVHSKLISSISQFRSSPHHIITASHDKSVSLWEINGFNKIYSQKLNLGRITSVKESPDNDLIFAVSGEKFYKFLMGKSNRKVISELKAYLYGITVPPKKRI